MAKGENTNGWNLFGFSFKRKEEKETIKSFTPEIKDDGAVVVSAGGTFGTFIDLDGTVRTEAELVSRYREMSIQPEIDKAVNEVINDAIVNEEGKDSVEIILDDLPVKDNLKKIITQEFKNILDLLDFKQDSYDIFKRWYIDGRCYYHVIIDEKVPQEGIKELRYIDPRTIRKVREVSKARDKFTDATIQRTKQEYYIYNERGLNYGSKVFSNLGTTGLKIQVDSIIQVVSGLMDSNNKMVLSYLHPGIKPLNQLRSLEDASLIYHLSRAPERRIFYLDVGNLPKMKAEQYVRDMMVRYKNKLAYNADTGEIRDDRKFMCYALDTKIPLLDGRTLELQDLITEYKQGKLNWVYSCDPVTGKFVPGPVSWAGITKKDARVVRVTFDNGKSVVCTPDHKFPVWGKGLVEAQHLVGESIIPGYRRQEKLNSSSKEYEQMYQNETGTWEFTHRLVSRWKDENNITEQFLYETDTIDRRVVHHKDFNRLNNAPDNLVIMDYDDHINYHSAIVSDRNRDKWATDKHIRNKNLNIITRKDLNRIVKLLGFKSWNDFKNGIVIDDKRYSSYNQAIKNLDVTTVRHSLNSELSYRGSENWKKKLSDARKGKASISKTWKVFKPDGQIEIVENLNKYARDNNLSVSNMRNSSSKGYKAEVLKNHKAVSVEWLDENIDVGCITVDLEETYHSHHTYLLDIGVYTKNTMLEDYWFPRREGGRATEVSILQGGTALPQLLQSVEYFQDRLYRSLQVPKSRMNPDTVYTLGRATEISRDELNFAKFIDRIRGKFSFLFLKALEKQLVLKGIATPEDWEQIKKFIRFRYLRDNYFTELKDMEILGERLNRLTQISMYAGKYYSNTWIRKNILRHTDEDILKMDEQIAQESQMIQYNPELLQQQGQPEGQEKKDESK